MIQITLDGLRQAFRDMQGAHIDTDTPVPIPQACYRELCERLNIAPDHDVLWNEKTFQYEGFTMAVIMVL